MYQSAQPLEAQELLPTSCFYVLPSRSTHTSPKRGQTCEEVLVRTIADVQHTAAESAQAPSPRICPTATASGTSLSPYAAHILATITQMKGRNATHSHPDKFHLFCYRAQTPPKGDLGTWLCEVACNRGGLFGFVCWFLFSQEVVKEEQLLQIKAV